jgi:hypothetical protein
MSKRKSNPLLARLEAVKFRKDGLRDLNEFMHPGECDFRGVHDGIAGLVLEHEVQRELAPYYENAKHAACGDYSLVQRGAGGIKTALVCFPSSLWASFFPLTFREITEAIGPINPDQEKLGAVTEIDQEWFSQGLQSTNPELSFHRIRIDWTKGFKAIQQEMEGWIKNMAKQHSPRRGRVQWKAQQDKLNQLAAWRAHRAGLNHTSFWQLAPRQPYTDATSFRTAWMTADKFLKDQVKRARNAVKKSPKG